MTFPRFFGKVLLLEGVLVATWKLFSFELATIVALAVIGVGVAELE